MLAACGLDGSLKVWQMSDLKEVTIDDGAAVPYHCLSWSPDGHYIFVGTDTGELRVWKDFALQPPLCRQDHAIQCVAVSADSKFVVTGQAANSKLATAHTTMPQVQIWDIAAGTMKASFTNDGAVNAVGISQAAESDLITAAGGASNDISFWRPGTGASEIKRGFGVGCVGSNIRWSSDLSADQSAHIPSKLRLRWTCTRSNPDGSTESSDLVYDCSTGTIRPPNRNREQRGIAR